jgi:acylphosphatase
MKKAVRLVVQGRVQGVGFRWFVQNEAEKLKINGYVRNMANGDVEVFAEGDDDHLKQIIRRVNEGPPFSRVNDMLTEWHDYKGRYQSFEISY